MLTLRVPAICASVLIAACLDNIQSPTVRDPLLLSDLQGVWVFHPQGGLFGDRIQLLKITSVTDTGPVEMNSLPTRRWDGSADSGLPVHDVRASIIGGILVWTMPLGAQDTLVMKYVLGGDTVRGTWQETGESVPVGLVGVRIRGGAIPRTPVLTPMAPDDSTPIVLIRIDDDQPTDFDFEARLRQRGLYAELAIPTAYVGKDGRPSWGDLATLTAQGFVPVAHSRVHGDAPVADEDFIGEVAGSLMDMSTHGLPTTIFVQPGTWHDSLDFTSPATFRNWRGATFRTLTSNVEAYAYPVPRLWPFADSLRLGLGHYTVSDGATPKSIMYAWQLAQQARHCTVFLVHTLTLASPSELDWFLDSLAAARNSGRVRLAHSSAAFYPLVTQVVR